MVQLLRQPAARPRLSHLLRGTLAVAVACAIAWPAGQLPRAHAAGTCDPSVTPTADDTPPAGFDTDAHIVSNFNAARQAEGCTVTFTLPNGYDGMSRQQQMLVLFNVERTDRGVGTLKLDGTLLSQIALNHSREFIQYNYFEHASPINLASPDRWSVNPAIANASRGLGEDISAGQQTSAEAVYGYMYQDSGSAWGHRTNILRAAYDWIGIGIAQGAQSMYGIYYTDDFLGDSAGTPYTPPASANTNSPSLDAPTLSGSTATVTNVKEQGNTGAITAVAFYTGSIAVTGHDANNNALFNTVKATSQGNGTWKATLPNGSTGTLHAVAVDASGNFTDVAAAGGTNTGTGGGTGGTNTGGTNTGGATNACASDGTCLTGLSAGNTAPSAGTSVTLTASTNNDVSSTVWYIDIVDENGAILSGCGSGSSCTATVSSASAATHHYTAQLSTAPDSIAGGGPKSSTVAVTWSAAAGGTNTGTGGGTGGTNTGGANNACASDGTCLTGLSAGNTAPSAGTSVTLKASTNNDVSSTVWYIDIVDENGTVLSGCGSGSSCTATVSSASAATHHYTAQLSTAPDSIAGGGPKSSTVTVTWS